MINNFDWKIKYQETNKELPLPNRIAAYRGLNLDTHKTINDMHDPFLMNDMDFAVMKIDIARENKLKVLIYGDYDVDGTTATTITYKFFRRIGINCDYYIPNRLKDGYGMSEKGINIAIDGGYDMVITVDCGITANSYVKTLKDNGIDVIITDHHEYKDELPEADAVIDCWRPDNTYPFQALCGAGVALKLCQAVCMELELGDIWKDYFMYAALGTVADVVILADENIIIVNEGLKQIKKTNDIGIRNLLAISGKLKDLHRLKASDIAFYLGPLINASSRMEDTSIIMGLFLSDNQVESNNYAMKLGELNSQRKQTEHNILLEAYEWLFENFDFKSLSPIVVCGKEWHKGVIGIVASRLVDNFSRPVIMLSESNGNYSGSCRTFGDINIMDILDYASEYIDNYGGHKEAAGLHVTSNNIEKFIDKVKEYGRLNFTEETFYASKEAEAVIDISDITLENAMDLEKFEPFGAGNPKPLFVCRGLKTRTLKKIGKKEGSENAHLKMMLCDKDNNLNLFDAIGFFMSDYCDILPTGRNIDVLFSLDVNEWDNKKSVQLALKDIHFEHFFREGSTVEESDLYSDDIVDIADIVERTGVDITDLIPSKDEYINVFNTLKKLFTEPDNTIILTSMDILSMIITTRINSEMNPFKLDRILECIDEAGFIYFRKLFYDKIILMPSPKREKIKISQTETYKKNHNC